MDFSADFWVQLLLIILGFVVVIVAIPRYRRAQTNKILAQRLRIEFSKAIRQTVPKIAATLIQTLDEQGPLRSGMSMTRPLSIIS